MEKLVDKYLDTLKVDELNYSDLNRIQTMLLSNDISFHIPRWNYLGKKTIEFISFSNGLMAWGEKNYQKIVTVSGEKLFYYQHFFDFINKLESLLSNQFLTYPLPVIGLLSYESCHKFEKIPKSLNFYQLPEFYLILPGDSILIDHSQKRIWKYSIHESIDNISSITNFDDKSLGTSETQSDYLLKIKRIRELITAGEVYQVNYTTRFSEKISNSGYHFFKKLYDLNPAPFSLYGKFPHGEIISNSPERFLFLDKNHVIAQPIKGTISRSLDLSEDNRLIQKLQNSEKDIAELSMIVDLLRNDISKVCIPGSVRVIKHKELITFENVHHLQSTISGIMKNDHSYTDLLYAAFPGGSITGCPKIAAMKYIAKLENHNRSFYTGSCFIRFPGENTFDSNILIRTIIKMGKWYHFQAGGGIVIDSIPYDEYNECITKASSFHKICRNMKR